MTLMKFLEKRIQDYERARHNADEQIRLCGTKQSVDTRRALWTGRVSAYKDILQWVDNHHLVMAEFPDQVIRIAANDEVQAVKVALALCSAADLHKVVEEVATIFDEVAEENPYKDSAGGFKEWWNRTLAETLSRYAVK